MELESAVASGLYIGRKAKGFLQDTFISKNYWVDSLSAVAVFQPVQLFNEMAVADMSFEECLDVRKVGVPVAMAITRPICKLRDKWGEKVWNLDSDSSKLRGIVSDFSFISVVQPIVYSSVMFAGGTDFGNIKESVPAVYFSVLALGLPYGVALNKVRDYFGVSYKGKE